VRLLGHTTRAPYYGFGLLTKFFRGPATIVEVGTSDPRLRAAAVRHHGTESMSIAVVNRYPATVPVRISLEGYAFGKPFRKYGYDSANVPYHPFGDLQDPADVLALAEGCLRDAIGPESLVVYTTAYDTETPGTVQGIEVTPDGTGVDLRWQPIADARPLRAWHRTRRTPCRATALPLGVPGVVLVIGVGGSPASSVCPFPVPDAMIGGPFGLHGARHDCAWASAAVVMG